MGLKSRAAVFCYSHLEPSLVPSSSKDECCHSPSFHPETFSTPEPADGCRLPGTAGVGLSAGCVGSIRKGDHSADCQPGSAHRERTHEAALTNGGGFGRLFR